MRLFGSSPRITPKTATEPAAATTSSETDASTDKANTIDKAELMKLAVTTFLAASGTAFAAQPPSPDLARAIAPPPASTLHLDRAAIAAIGPSSAMGRAVEVALRTGTFVIPQATLPDVITSPSDLPLVTSSTTATVLDVPTSTILAPDKVWMITTTAMASSSPLAQAFLQDLPPLQQTLATEILARAAAGDEQIGWSLLNAFRESVRTEASADDRRTMIRTALTTGTPLDVVLAQPGVFANATPRQLDVINALSALGDNQIYSFRLIDSIVATVIDPVFTTKTPAEQQAVFTSLFSDRSHYIGVMQTDLGKADVVIVDGGAALTAAACSATPAREFRVDDRRAHPQGCAQTVTFTTPTGPHSLDIITPPTLSPNHPAVDQTARALARVDDGVRTLIKTVVLNPVENPDDAMWRATPGFSSTHTSFMTARTTDNTVHLYPTGLPSTGVVLERLLAGTFTHEAAHLLQPLVQKDPALQALWIAAVESDDLRASSYAFSNDAEDFAEAFTVFMTSKGSPAHEIYRELMPARFTAFEAIEAKLLTPAATTTTTTPATTTTTTTAPRS